MTERTIGKPRGVLRSAPSEGSFEHERRAPDEDLAPFVEHFWRVAWAGVREPVVREVLSHPSVHVTFEQGKSGVAGVVRGRYRATLAGTGVVLGVKFRPGCFRPFVAFPIARIADRTLTLDAVFGKGTSALEREVLAERSMAGMIAVASRFLRARLPPVDPRAEEAAAVVKRILEDREILRVEDVARACGSNPRALQRLFSEYVGVSPKWVIRRYRLHEALARVDEGTVVDWAALSLDLGYFDQAHFVRDFKALVGRTPTAYARAPSAPGAAASHHPKG